jgi:hypothetical protein
MSEHRLSEVVIERPRQGLRISLKKYSGFKKQLQKLTQEASEDGLFRPYLIKPRNKTKYFSDHLSPLRRYLRSKVGQPWNVVYSELCHRLDPTTLAGQHVISHVWDYVERYVELIDGIPYRKASKWRAEPLKNHYYETFYVHPETGILSAVHKTASPPKLRSSNVEIVVLDDKHEYHNLAGIWYLITFAELPLSPNESVFDVLKGVLSHRDPKPWSFKNRYAARKRQCNKKEIQAIVKRISGK